MKLITRNTDYGIRALCFLAQKDGAVVSVAELIKALKMPRPFLRKIMQALTKSGFVSSYRGIGGGFELAKAPDHIYIVEVARTFQGPMTLNECLLKKKICPNRRSCPLKKKIEKIERGVLSELKSITIAELLKG